MFYIVNQGEGIKTPIESLVRRRIVDAVSAIVPVLPIEEKKLTQTEKQLRSYKKQQGSSERKAAVYAGQIMTVGVKAGRTDQLLAEIWEMFSFHRIHHIPLLDSEHKLQGIVSDRDLLRFVASNNYRDMDRFPISELMTSAVIAALAKTEIRTLAEVMCRQSIGAIPIVNEEMEVVGLVSRTDILRTIVHQAPLELWT